MKPARNYVFVLAPILFERLAHTRVPVASNGSSPPDQKHEETLRCLMRHRDGCNTRLCRVTYSGPGSSITRAGTCSEHKEEKLEH